MQRAGRIGFNVNEMISFYVHVILSTCPTHEAPPPPAATSRTYASSCASYRCCRPATRQYRSLRPDWARRAAPWAPRARACRPPRRWSHCCPQSLWRARGPPPRAGRCWYCRRALAAAAQCAPAPPRSEAAQGGFGAPSTWRQRETHGEPSQSQRIDHLHGYMYHTFTESPLWPCTAATTSLQV